MRQTVYVARKDLDHIGLFLDNFYLNVVDLGKETSEQ